VVRIKVKNVSIHENYQNCDKEYYGPNVYDLALLKLDENDLKNNEKFIPKEYLKI
jgi:hypothetical protein